MEKVLVTGGCGFLGTHIVQKLLSRGVGHVRVLALPDETSLNLEGLDVELVRGNILNRDDCKRAVQGIDTLFHAAAMFKAFMPDPTPMYEVNIRGTFNMLEAARRAGVGKVIYTASIVALGRPEPGRLGDEDTAYDAWDLTFPYSRAKYHSRVLAEDFGHWGMDVRVVCPGMIFGPGDIGPTPSGQIIVDVLKTTSFTKAPRSILKAMRGGSIEGVPPLYVDGGSSFVDVRDVAEVHLLAAERGRANRRYIATAHNLTQGEFVEAVSRAAQIDRKFMKVPEPLARQIVRRLEKHALATGSEPALSESFFEYSLKPSFFSNRRSVQELGASYRPLGVTLRDAVAYFRRRGYIA